MPWLIIYFYVLLLCLLSNRGIYKLNRNTLTQKCIIVWEIWNHRMKITVWRYRKISNTRRSVAGLICRKAARIRQLPVPPEKSCFPFRDILTVLQSTLSTYEIAFCWKNVLGTQHRDIERNSVSNGGPCVLYNCNLF